jgi:hypothetical protein
MADVFTNDLRIREQESGSNAGTWGGLLNTTIRNIASAFGQGSETIPNASTHTITLADGVADEARSLYLKCTGGGQACTVTLAPNTVSKVWIISNETSYTLTFSQGSGANVAVAAGAVKVIVTDGAGSGAAVVDALSGLDASLSGLTVDTTTLVVDATNNRVGIGTSSPSNTLTITNGSSGATEANGAIVPLMIENSSSAYINFLTPNNANAGLLFSDPEGNNVGQMQYLHGSNALVFATGASEAMRILSNQRVSIGGTSSNHLLNVTSSTTPALEFTRGSGNATIGIDNGNSIAVGGTAGDLVLRASGTTGVTKFTDSGGNITMTLTEANNVGIGTSSPTDTLNISSNTNQIGLDTGDQATYGTLDVGHFANGAFIGTQAGSNAASNLLRFGTSGTERMRIDSSGNLLVGGTDTDPGSTGSSANAGTAIGASGYVSVARTGGSAIRAGRIDSNGAIIEFFGDGSAVGKIGTDGSDIYIGSDDTNLLFFQNGFLPANSVGGTRDNASDLGAGSARFKDLYLANVMYSGSARIATTTANSGGKIQVKTFSGGIFQVFQNSSGSTIGYIGNVSNSQTLYAQTSDERLKENITDSADAGSRIDAIQVRQFDWKADGIHQDYGMVAQELQTVAPEVVFEPEDSNDMMGVDYSKLVPMLVKEIQSLRARVQQLENN